MRSARHHLSSGWLCHLLGMLFLETGPHSHCCHEEGFFMTNPSTEIQLRAARLHDILNGRHIPSSLLAMEVQKLFVRAKHQHTTLHLTTDLQQDSA